jgi:hypothetical protein
MNCWQQTERPRRQARKTGKRLKMVMITGPGYWRVSDDAPEQEIPDIMHAAQSRDK